MNLPRRRAMLIRAGALATVLAVGGTIAAYAAHPPASDGGLAHAAAGAANAAGHEQSGDHPGSTGASAVPDRLAANLDRLEATLQDVLDRLTNGHAPDAAVNAIQAVIDRLGGDTGLNHAAQAVGGDHGSPDLPAVVANHPGRP